MRWTGAIQCIALQTRRRRWWEITHLRRRCECTRWRRMWVQMALTFCCLYFCITERHPRMTNKPPPSPTPTHYHSSLSLSRPLPLHQPVNPSVPLSLSERPHPSSVCNNNNARATFISFLNATIVSRSRDDVASNNRAQTENRGLLLFFPIDWL